MVIKRKDNYWVDNRNNRWYVEWYSKKEAEKYSATLINCSGCTDCNDCSHCTDCYECLGCKNCTKCNDCSWCTDCSGCEDCWNCSYCYNCSNCDNCSQCSDCSSCDICEQCNSCSDCIECTACRGCHDCAYFSENPERIVGTKMGAKNDTLTVYWTEIGKEQCVVNCIFHGTLDELEKAVEETHKNNEKYLIQYRQFIKKVRAYQEMKI